MSEQGKPVGASDKMKAKDFITLGIFTVLFFAVVMVCIFASAATVVTFAFGSAIAAIPGGIIYMLMRAKVPKAGSVLLSGVVIGLIEFLIGAGWAVAVGFIAGAVIAELLFVDTVRVVAMHMPVYAYDVLHDRRNGSQIV